MPVASEGAARAVTTGGGGVSAAVCNGAGGTAAAVVPGTGGAASAVVVGAGQIAAGAVSGSFSRRGQLDRQLLRRVGAHRRQDGRHHVDFMPLATGSSTSSLSTLKMRAASLGFIAE